METNRIEHFCVFATIGNLRKTAEIVGLSHSALSKSFKVLEQELNLKLFHQEGRELLLTEEGKEFYRKAQVFIPALKDLLSPKEETTKVLRLGTFEVFSTYFMGQVLQEDFLSHHIRLQELIPGQLELALENDLIDVGITYDPVPFNSLSYLKVGSVKMGIFGVKKFQSYQNFSQLPFVAPLIPPPPAAPSSARGLDGFPDEKIKRHIVYQVVLMESALHICEQGRAVGQFPDFVIKLHNARVQDKFKLFPIPNPPGLKEVTREVFLLKRKSFEENEDIKKLAKHLRRHLNTKNVRN